MPRGANKDIMMQGDGSKGTLGAAQEEQDYTVGCG